MAEVKYTFTKFIAALEGDDFNILETEWLDWATIYVSKMPELLNQGIHGGDCTSESHPCRLCVLETQLAEYRRYVNDSDAFLVENGLFKGRRFESVKKLAGIFPQGKIFIEVSPNLLRREEHPDGISRVDLTYLAKYDIMKYFKQID
jgi:hypothetical protein